MSDEQESVSSILAGSSAFARAPEKQEPSKATDVKSEATTPKEPAAVSAAREVSTTEVAAKAETPKEAASARDDKGRFAKPEEKSADDKTKTVPHGALHAARERARKAEEELARERQAKPAPSVLEDEDAAFSARLNSALRPWQERYLTLSMKLARN